MNLVYVGNSYYRRSGTKLGFLYHENSWKKSDWGFVQVALMRGSTVTIRPATLEELDRMDKMLGESMK